MQISLVLEGIHWGTGHQCPAPETLESIIERVKRQNLTKVTPKCRQRGDSSPQIPVAQHHAQLPCLLWTTGSQSGREWEQAGNAPGGYVQGVMALSVQSQSCCRAGTGSSRSSSCTALPIGTSCPAPCSKSTRSHLHWSGLIQELRLPPLKNIPQTSSAGRGSAGQEEGLSPLSPSSQGTAHHVSQCCSGRAAELCAPVRSHSGTVQPLSSSLGTASPDGTLAPGTATATTSSASTPCSRCPCHKGDPSGWDLGWGQNPPAHNCWDQPPGGFGLPFGTAAPFDRLVRLLRALTS